MAKKKKGDDGFAGSWLSVGRGECFEVSLKRWFRLWGLPWREGRRSLRFVADMGGSRFRVFVLEGGVFLVKAAGRELRECAVMSRNEVAVLFGMSWFDENGEWEEIRMRVEWE